jgi:hypothetical protein
MQKELKYLHAKRIKVFACKMQIKRKYISNIKTLQVPLSQVRPVPHTNKLGLMHEPPAANSTSEILCYKRKNVTVSKLIRSTTQN